MMSFETCTGEIVERIIPADKAKRDKLYHAIFCKVAGDIKIQSKEGDPVLIKEMDNVSVYPIWVKRVFKTGTTARKIFGVRRK